MWFLLVLLFVALSFVWFCYDRLSYWQRQGLRSPGPIYQWNYHTRELGPYDEELRAALGSLYGTYSLLSPILVVSEPDLVREVLVTEFPKFPNHKPLQVGEPELDRNMFSLEGTGDWRRIRALITPSFSPASIRAMTPPVLSCLSVLTGHLRRAAGTQVDVRPYFTTFVMDVLLRTAYGAEIDSFKDPQNPLSRNVEKMYSARLSGILLLLFPRLSALIGTKALALAPFRYFIHLADTLIRERKGAPPGSAAPNDFLQHMIDANGRAGGLSEAEMRAQTLTLLLASVETTATAMFCAVYYLATEPGAQERLWAEVSAGPALSYDSLAECTYLEAFVKETLRLSPPVIRVERQCVSRHKLGGVQLEPGHIVSVPVFALHRDPESFPEPNAFRPERFLPGSDQAAHHPFAYLPFGGGPRTCIAQRSALFQTKLALAVLLREFRFEATKDTKLSYHTLSYDGLNPKEIFVRIEERTEA